MPDCSCSVCFKRVFDSQRGIFCDCCKHWVHLSCTKFSYNEYIKLSNVNADWYCYLCVMDIFPFNKLEEFKFQLALAEFSIGHAKIGFKSLDELHINTGKVIDENNDPDLNFFNKTVNEDKYVLDNELNKLIPDLNINYSKDTFSLMHINARSINKNIEAIDQMLSSLRISFDIIEISETWISEPNDLIQMENYKLICSGRRNRKGGGLGPKLQS